MGHRRQFVSVLVAALLVALAACEKRWFDFALPSRNSAPVAVIALGRSPEFLSPGVFCAYFDGSASTDPEEDGAKNRTGGIAYYNWDFGDGSAPLQLRADVAAPNEGVPGCPSDKSSPPAPASKPTHVYRVPSGTVAIAKLHVIDNDGENSQVASLRVILRSNRPPVARFVATPTSGPVPLIVSFASQSTDPDPDDAESLEFYWDFGDGTCDPSPCGARPAPSPRHAALDHRYTSQGEFTATLEVRDGSGGVSGPAYQTIAVTR